MESRGPGAMDEKPERTLRQPKGTTLRIAKVHPAWTSVLIATNEEERNYSSPEYVQRRRCLHHVEEEALGRVAMVAAGALVREADRLHLQERVQRDLQT